MISERVDSPAGLPGLPGARMETALIAENIQGTGIDATKDSSPEPERIRSLFPETWLWDMFELGFV